MARLPQIFKRGPGKGTPQGATSAVPMEDVLAMLNAQQNVRDNRGGSRTPAYMPTPQEWDTDPFGPGFRIRPEAINNLRGDNRRADPRIYEYPIAWNLRTEQQRLIPWSTLRQASQAPLVRPIITKRQKDLTSLKWEVTVTRGAIEKAAAMSNGGSAQAASILKHKFAADIERVAEFWRYPDREQGYGFADWLWQGAEEQLVLDAVSISPRVTYGGDVYGFRLLDGSTIKPLLDPYGARPMPPAPAYQQILYGFPRGEWTADLNENGEVVGYPADQLVYRRRNVRTFTPYGLSPVEECLADLDLFLKRHGWMRAEYTEGTLAEAYLKSPSDLIWSPAQLLEYERQLNDSTSGSTQERHRMRMLPPGIEPVITGDTAERYKPEYDVYLVALVTTHFGEHPEELGFTIGRNQLSGSGASQLAKQTSVESGLFPDARYWANVVTHLSREYLGLPKECEFKFLDIDAENQVEADALADAQVAQGRKTLNEDRDRMGLPRYDDPMADKPLIITASGAVTLDAAMQAIQSVPTTGADSAKPAASNKPAAAAKPKPQKPTGPSRAPGNTTAVGTKVVKMVGQQGAVESVLNTENDVRGEVSNPLGAAADHASDRTAAIGLAQAEINMYRRWAAKRSDVPSRDFEFSAEPELVKALLEPGEGHYTFKGVLPAHHVAHASKVHAVMAENFPADALEWVHRAKWEGPVKVPAAHIDMDGRNTWAASHEPDHVAKVTSKIEAGKKIKPAILIREPGKRRFVVVDGHHRVLGAVHADAPVRAYVGTVPAEDVDEALITHVHQNEGKPTT